MKNFKTIDEYISSQPGEYREKLENIRTIIGETAPQTTEYIGYGMPGFKYLGKPLAYFMCAKKHIGFYPTPGPITHFQKELGEYATSKGAIQFLYSQDLPFALIKKMLQFRMGEIISLHSSHEK